MKIGKGLLALIFSVSFAVLAKTPPDRLALARQAAREGMVLLENRKSALPLKKGEGVALLGPGQIHLTKGGTGSGIVENNAVVTFLQGALEREKAGDIAVCKELAAKYQAEEKYQPAADELKSAAEKHPVAVIFITRQSGEGGDRRPVEGDYYLSNEEKNLLNLAQDAGFKKIVLVANVGGAIDCAFMGMSSIDALIFAWQPGQEGGHALWDILCGDFSPCGKLPMTVARDYYDYPSAATFTRSREYTEYSEGVFVGYRHFATFDPEREKVAYPFGYGLSYTGFQISGAQISVTEEEVGFSLNVRNAGCKEGREVVQLYFAPPKGEIEKPALSLLAYGKTPVLKPGEECRLNLSAPKYHMASFSEKERRYVMEKGSYAFYLGNSLWQAQDRGEAGYLNLDGPRYFGGELKPFPAFSEYSMRDDGKSYSPFEFSQRAWGMRLYNIRQMQENDIECLRIPKNEWMEYAIFCEDAGVKTLSLLLKGQGQVKAVFDGLGEAAFICSGQEETMHVARHLSKGFHRLKLQTVEPLDVLALRLCRGETTMALLQRPIKRPSEESLPKGHAMSFKEVLNNPERLDEFVEALSLEELVDILGGQGARRSTTGTIASKAERDIKGLETTDGPAGLRTNRPQTAWPIALALASTFDTGLVSRVGLEFGREMLEEDLQLLLAPGLNIERNPLCGRNFEYYSEDPVLSGRTAAAMVRGVQSQGVGAEIKHYCANNREECRLLCDSRVSERVLREIYLRGFEIAVKESQPWAVMSSYNLLNGLHTSENSWLLETVLRDEWGFKGFVTTDWGGAGSGWKEIRSGNDVQMGYGEKEEILLAVRQGFLKVEQLKKCVRRVLAVVLLAEPKSAL